MLQAPQGTVPALVLGADEPAVTPFAEILGVRVHSGDILVSRGGAPTSALIARGNDYQGNFSHVALIHVERDGSRSMVEAHIERVAVATLPRPADVTAGHGAPPLGRRHASPPIQRCRRQPAAITRPTLATRTISR
jgi:hypothetical protein